MEADPIEQCTIIDLLDREFSLLLAKLTALVKTVPDELLYQRPPAVTVGESILRSAAVMEQTFGGLTASLWDDPFEWTLPETLSNANLVCGYLSEVDEARCRVFSFVGSDEALLKYVSVPSGESRPLLSLLLETLARASYYRGRAEATLKMLSDVGPPGVII